jgi:hypothetical protein
METGGDAGEGIGFERLESRLLLWERARGPALAVASSDASAALL